MQTMNDLLLNPAPLATEVSALALPGEEVLRLVWATATPEQEAVHLGTVETSGRLREEDGWPGIQPRLGSIGERLLLLFLGAPDLRPTLVLDGGEPVHLSQCPGHQPCLASGPDLAWAAWCAHHHAKGWVVRLRHIDPRGRFTEAASLAGHGCGLGSVGHEARLIWIDGDEVRCARLGEDGPMAPELVAKDPGAELPVLAADDQGRWVAAWQGRCPHGVLRWPRLARLEAHGWRRLDPPLPREDMHLERHEAGEDQGWEVPTLLSHDGGVWLAGRSAQGFRAQRLQGEQWSQRLDLSRTGWSGRSRNMALVILAGEVSLLRGTPKGLSLATLKATPGDPVATAPPPAPGRAALESVPGPEAASGHRLLFGDLHQHSMESDGLGTVADAYRRARDLYGHDFAALTDHDGLAGGCLGPLTWRQQVELADAFYEPGKFVTLRGFEFTGSRLPGRGHKCVYFDDAVPVALPGRDPDRLDELLSRYPSLAIPHHTAWTGADMEHHDPTLQAVWEICSVHGSYEGGGDSGLPPRPDVVLPGQFIQDALAAGLKFGLIGGTDNHGLRWHHGVGFKADPHRCGLAAVMCQPTRESLLAALRARHCYATSGARILLSLDLQGAPMGSEVQLSGAAELVVQARGTAPIQRLSLLQDGQVIKEASGGANLTLRHPVRATPTQQSSVILVTLLQRDGEAAWSSPIWLSGA